jgi:spore maturation protein SpmB
MTEFADIILRSGKLGVELAMFVLLPVMIVMLTIMRMLEAKGVLQWLVERVSPLLTPFGLAGLGVFALLQTSFVGVAAPVATLAMMDKGGSSPRHIAATLAMVFSLAQANVVFPMAAFGLNTSIALAVSLVGGIAAAAVTYHVFARHLPDEDLLPEPEVKHPSAEGTKGVLAIINRAGAEALSIAVGAIPLLVLALVLVNIIRDLGVVSYLEAILNPVFLSLDIPSASILSIVTKYIAGGSAMMGVTVDLMNAGQISVTDFNRLAGFLIHPFDIAGVAILISAGPRVASVVRPALFGAVVAILVRSVLHFLVF